MSVTRQLATFVVGTDYEQLPPKAIRLAKHAMLDCVGVTFAGAREPACRKILDLVDQLGGKPQAQVIAAPLRTSPALAALVNGAMGHALDYDDACNFGHPSVVLLPPIFALGELLHSSGRQAIVAYAAGFEIGARIREAFDITHHNGWHPTGICGTMAAAAAAAKMLRLDVHETVMALGIAGSQAAGLGVNIGSMTKPFHAGNASKAGVVAAMLAQNGFTASENSIDSPTGFARAFGGGRVRDLGALTRDLGNGFELERRGLSLKKYPSCYGTHWAIDEVLDLVAAEEISASQVASVQCIGRPKYLDVLPYSEPRTGLEGKFSMQYCVAASILDRVVGVDQFTDAKVQSAAAVTLMRKITLRAFPDWDQQRDVDSRPEEVTLRLADGREFTRRILKLPGQDTPDRWDESMARKFRECAQPTLGRDRAEQVMRRFLDLETVNDLAPLAQLLAAQRPSPYV